MADFDVIVVGAGHNALVCAAYLAKAGYRVGVFERRSMVGGAVATSDAYVPGYRFDLGGSAHILIRLTPVVEELGLEAYGLDYLDLDPLFFAPFEDGDSFTIRRSVDETCELLERQYGEGDAYRRFINDWKPFSDTVKDVFLQTPSPLNIGRTMRRGTSTSKPWKEALQFILRPYGEVAAHYFREPKLRAALCWMAAQSGPPPSEPMGSPFLLWHPLYHEGGVARPRGGSGMLTVALRRMIEAHGGLVFTDTPITSFLVSNNGRISSVQALDQTITARAVVAGTHAVESLTHLLPEAYRPPEAQNLRVGNGFGAVLRLALSQPVHYAATPDPADNLAARTGLGLLCPSVEHIGAAYGDYLAGKPAADPPLVAMTFSAVDDSLAPPGGEVLWLWGQYFPYELANGASWDDIGPAVADRFLDVFERYAPGTRETVVGSLFQHPLWLERELGLRRGNVMHLEMTLDQMFCARPLIGMAGYQTHVKGLFLTGASTHPGGGIMGASGRNAAGVILKALDKLR